MVRWSLLPVNDEPYHKTSRAFYVWSPNNNNLTILIKMENFCLNIDIIFTQSFGDNDLVFTKQKTKNTHTDTHAKKNIFYLRQIDSMKKGLMTSLNDIGAVPHEHRSTGKNLMHWNISAFIMQLLLLSIRLPKYVYHNLTSQE